MRNKCLREHLAISRHVQACSPVGQRVSSRLALVLGSLCAAPCAWATGIESGAFLGLIKVLLSLGVIIVAIYLVVALMRRVTLSAGGAQSLPVRVRGGVMVGQRERVVVVEVKDTWLILGVTAAQVTLLHSLPREETDLLPPKDINPQLWVRQWLAARKSADKP